MALRSWLVLAWVLVGVLAFARAAEARVGIAEWSIETRGGLVVCHCDVSPTGGEGIVIYEPGTLLVRDIADFKVYSDAIVGVTQSGESFLVDDRTRAVHRFAARSELATFMARVRPGERGWAAKPCVVWGGYLLVALAIARTLSRLATGRGPMPAERAGFYVLASALAITLATLSFMFLPWLAPPDMQPGELVVGCIARPGECLPWVVYLALVGGAVPFLIVSASMGLGGLATLLTERIAPRLGVPPRWARLAAYVSCHLVVLRLTVGEYILRTNPYWRGDL